MERFVYADNAATTKITQPVLDAMMPYLNRRILAIPPACIALPTAPNVRWSRHAPK